MDEIKKIIFENDIIEGFIGNKKKEKEKEKKS